MGCHGGDHLLSSSELAHSVAEEVATVGVTAGSADAGADFRSRRGLRVVDPISVVASSLLLVTVLLQALIADQATVGSCKPTCMAGSETPPSSWPLHSW